MEVASAEATSTVGSVPFPALLETLTSSNKPIPAHLSSHPSPRSPPVPGGLRRDLLLDNHPAPLRRAAAGKPLGNLAGPAGAGQVIYDPHQLFRKQKLTRRGLGSSFEVHGFVFLQLSPAIKQFLVLSARLLQLLPRSLITPLLSQQLSLYGFS